MLWSMMRLIFKTSAVTPDFFYVFNLILSFSTCSESFEKICTWELLGANVLKRFQEVAWFAFLPVRCINSKTTLHLLQYIYIYIFFFSVQCPTRNQKYPKRYQNTFFYSRKHRMSNMSFLYGRPP